MRTGTRGSRVTGFDAFALTGQLALPGPFKAEHVLGWITCKAFNPCSYS
jgi:hypothetical protein